MDKRTEKITGKNKVAERTWKDKDTILKPRYRRLRANKSVRLKARKTTKDQACES